jgi:hypothetical protein
MAAACGTGGDVASNAVCSPFYGLVLVRVRPEGHAVAVDRLIDFGAVTIGGDLPLEMLDRVQQDANENPGQGPQGDNCQEFETGAHQAFAGIAGFERT